MKKIILACLIICSTAFLSSCFEDSKKVDDAKKELWIIDDNDIQKAKEDLVLEEKDKQGKEVKEKEIKEDVKISNYKIENITLNNFIELDSLEWENFNDWEVEIKWKTLLNVDKIEVSFSNEDSDFPDDLYTLKQFKSWDSNFTYRAFSRYQTLDFWKNTYVITAYSWNDTSKTSLVINVIKETVESKEVKKTTSDSVSYEKQMFWPEDEKVYLSFPKSDTFWEMVKVSDSSFTYSIIDNLEVTKRQVSSINCENITDVLSESLNSWFFWNTCRDIIKEKWIKFYVLRLDWEKYIYERHYVDYTNSLYWVYLLETWTWVSSENIKEKNNELKVKEYKNIEIVDSLFYEIVR